MVGRTKYRTSADVDRLDRISSIGCIVSGIYFGRWRTPGDIHHLLIGGRRYEQEHQYTVCLTPWYHRGVTPTDRRGRRLTIDQAEAFFGPSLALNKRAFELRFGTELELLEMTNAILAQGLVA